MEVVPWVFTSGWASGINGYAVVWLLGLMGRYLGLDGVPEVLQRTDVMVAAGVLFLIDAVADKIPYVDTAWDAVHTAIRPAIGAVVAALIAGDATTLGQAVAAVTGGATALASHAVKAGIRAGVNTSPEPASNIVVSTAEDVTVASVVALAALFPWLAAGIAAFLLVTGGALVVFVVRWVRRRTRRRAYDHRGTPPDGRPTRAP
jgi:hypothetical protein